MAYVESALKVGRVTRIVVVLFSLHAALSAEDPTEVGPRRAFEARRQFCVDRAQRGFVNRMMHEGENLMGFANSDGSGIWGVPGVCWWHNLFQRSSAYLSLFRPDLPPPSREGAREIVGKIRAGDEVVVVPGFENLNSFSQHYHEFIQSELERWQRRDILVNQAWLPPFFERREADPEVLARRMHELYFYVKEGNVAYQRLHFPGIRGVHSWLVVGMERVADGYFLSVVDSDNPVSVRFFLTSTDGGP